MKDVEDMQDVEDVSDDLHQPLPDGRRLLGDRHQLDTGDVPVQCTVCTVYSLYSLYSLQCSVVMFAVECSEH